MKRIYDKAQQEHEIETVKKLNNSVEGIPADSPERVEKYINALEAVVSPSARDDLDRLVAERKMAANLLSKTQKEAERLPSDSPESKAAYKRGLEDIVKALEKADEKTTAWDFSKEKQQSVFACAGEIVIRPINTGDVELYTDIRMQYSMMYRSMIVTGEHRKESLFLLDLCHFESFYCAIVVDEKTIGYLGIKDTRVDLWEIAIELDETYVHCGYGPQSIKLFLNEVFRITGKSEFRALVEPDNIPSQRCFEKLGELVGLCNSKLLSLPEDQVRFEERNLNLIDNHIREIANHIGVEPRKLLSHVLDYRLNCPLT